MDVQKENGFTSLNHVTLEVLSLIKLTEYERCIIGVIIRKTWGFNKTWDWIANSQFVEATGIEKGNVRRTVRMLEAKNIVVCRDNKISIQKDPSKWIVVWRDNNSYLRRQQKLSVQTPTIDRKIKDKKGNKVSHLLDKKNHMPFNKKSDNDEDLPEIDMDSRETRKTGDELYKEKNAKKMKYKKEMVALLITVQNKDKSLITVGWRRKQYKALEDLYHMKVSRNNIMDAINEYEKAEWFKGTPDFMSIVSKFEKKV